MVRCRNTAQNLPMQSPSAFILPLLFPLLTTVRTSWNVDSRPVLRAESACDLHLCISPLVLALQANAAPIFQDSEYFCCSHHHHFLLQSKLLGMWILDQFYTLNPPVISVCPYLLWLLRQQQTRSYGFSLVSTTRHWFPPPDIGEQMHLNIFRMGCYPKVQILAGWPSYSVKFRHLNHKQWAACSPLCENFLAKTRL